MFFVQVGSQVVSQEDGPDDGKRPDVGVEMECKRPQQIGRLDLSIVDERRHDEDDDGRCVAVSDKPGRGARVKLSGLDQTRCENKEPSRMGERKRIHSSSQNEKAALL
jgi:hypothetical protein